MPLKTGLGASLSAFPVTTKNLKSPKNRNPRVGWEEEPVPGSFLNSTATFRNASGVFVRVPAVDESHNCIQI